MDNFEFRNIKGKKENITESTNECDTHVPMTMTYLLDFLGVSVQIPRLEWHEEPFSLPFTFKSEKLREQKHEHD